MMPLDPRCVNRGSTGRNRGPPDKPVTSGTAPLLHQGPLRPRQSYGRWCQCGAPVNAGRVPVNRRSAGTPPPFTGVKPGRNRISAGVCRYCPGECRRSYGLHRGVTGENRCSAGASSG
ncbi:hypothetical protein DPMN_124625 [Dreissena polymorpha]|uniref:Uncharacterized protein n=1 Tax=Dreissena polymorpha TaxID=45954 RepID=A0A9D4GTR2_DREPO|nr:hypothetical protein DPMN_124625 [Dreissena polymorpha]